MITISPYHTKPLISYYLELCKIPVFPSSISPPLSTEITGREVNNADKANVSYKSDSVMSHTIRSCLKHLLMLTVKS